MGSGAKLAVAAGVALVMASGVSHHGHGGILDTLTAVPLTAGSYAQRTWAREVLAADALPRTGANVASLVAWSGREAPWNGQPPDGALYTRNPLNLTHGAGAVATVPGTPGVSILPDWRTGIRDTAALLASGPYGDVFAALRSGAGLCGRSFTGLSTWSGAGYSAVC